MWITLWISQKVRKTACPNVDNFCLNIQTIQQRKTKRLKKKKAVVKSYKSTKKYKKMNSDKCIFVLE